MTRHAAVSIEVAASTAQVQDVHTLTLAFSPIAAIELRAEVPFYYNRQRFEAFGFGQNPTTLEPTVQQTAGLGDVRFIARAWLPFDVEPLHLYVEAGIKTPTGESHITTIDANGRSIPAWMSAQLGNGAWQPIAGLGARARFDWISLFAQFQYMFSPGGTTGTPVTAEFVLPFYSFNALFGQDERKIGVTDVYTWRVGAAVALKVIREQVTDDPIAPLDGSGISFSIEDISVPGHDLFGNSTGFRDGGDFVYAVPGIFFSPVDYITVTGAVAVPIYRFVRDHPQTVDDIRAEVGVSVAF